MRFQLRASGLGFRVQGLGFRVYGSGFRVSGLSCPAKAPIHHTTDLKAKVALKELHTLA